MSDDVPTTERVQGVVARAKGAPVTVETVLVPAPGPGEARVRVQACGVCHTDLHYREGGIGSAFPYLLGHEAAGIVESVGPDVVDVAPGDYVVLNWRAVCARVPGLPSRPTVALLRHAQRRPVDDPRGRHGPLAGTGHRCLRRPDARRGGPVHQGRPGCGSGGRGPAGLWGDGRTRSRHQHRRCHPRRFGRGDRVRRCR